VKAELAALWATAEARRDAGEPALRPTAYAYSLPPGDADITARAWLTEAEAMRAEEIRLALQRLDSVDAAGAHGRIMARIAAGVRGRRIAA